MLSLPCLIKLERGISLDFSVGSFCIFKVCHIVLKLQELQPHPTEAVTTSLLLSTWKKWNPISLTPTLGLLKVLQRYRDWDVIISTTRNPQLLFILLKLQFYDDPQRMSFSLSWFVSPDCLVQMYSRSVTERLEIETFELGRPLTKSSNYWTP